jgi:hypothetical protein
VHPNTNRVFVSVKIKVHLKSIKNRTHCVEHIPSHEVSLKTQPTVRKEQKFFASWIYLQKIGLWM